MQGEISWTSSTCICSQCAMGLYEGAAGVHVSEVDVAINTRIIITSLCMVLLMDAVYISGSLQPDGVLFPAGCYRFHPHLHRSRRLQ